MRFFLMEQSEEFGFLDIGKRCHDKSHLVDLCYSYGYGSIHLLDGL